jgi:hypothetical protein
MNRTASMRRFALGLALGAIAGIAVLVVAAHGGITKRAPVMLGRTALGSVLVDARGRTLYAFDKDAREGVHATRPARRTGRRSSLERRPTAAREFTSPCSASSSAAMDAAR